MPHKDSARYRISTVKSLPKNSNLGRPQSRIRRTCRSDASTLSNELLSRGLHPHRPIDLAASSSFAVVLEDRSFCGRSFRC
ncbi:hypothetical protein OPV22_005156 [Ensete ventricosum]|uniref:Uncharacterized protein n=1 Tax=Ensete ventricosum TaxID=4639 RepID=A0AAV8RQX8_ENSVE|nr:hypothetical protein OPV22_005156 [Ensete ventricosum]